MDYPALLWLSFLAGIYAPVGSPCVIIIYPGYLAFLAGMGGQEQRDKESPPLMAGIAVACGVMISLLVGGFLLGFAVQAAGPAARALLQPAVSFLLLIFALCLIFDYPLLSGRSPLTVPRAGTPAGSALLLGLFMGLIILPCNAAVILFLLTLAISVGTAAEAIGLFLAFGIGIVLPLLILSGISRFRSRQVLSCLTRHRLAVQRTAGLVMLAVAAGYLALALFTGVP